jgi:twitching motility protein PilT
MPAKNPPPLLGRLAVHYNMLTDEQVAECTREQARDANPKPVGEYFVDNGYMTRAQLQKLLRAQKQIVEQHQANQAKTAKRKPAEPAPAATKRPIGRIPLAKAEAPRPSAAGANTETPPAVVARKAEPLQAVATGKAEPAPVVATGKVEPAPSVAAERAESLPGSGSIVLESKAFECISHDSGPLDELLRHGVERGASDIHVHAESPFMLRVQGSLLSTDPKVIDPATTERMLIGALGDADREQLQRDGQLDLSYTVEGLARFRANIFRQQSGFDGIFRSIRPEPPTLEDLGLPQDLARFTNYHQGMVLLTGPTGCGKSSTLAALVDLINFERKEHLLTIEDPIEYQYTPKRCIVNQRSVHRHTGSFARALRAALREDPDVIVIGELRDLETISLAMTAAETGHFVLATLHTGGAIRTLNRLIGSFPSNKQDQVRKMLSESLRAVISQRLVRKADGSGQTPALETLVVTKAVGNLIRENKAFQIQSILQTGAAQGMVMLDQSIRALVKSGTISREEALLHVEDPKILGGS